MIYINNEKKLKRIKNEKDIFVITDFDRTLTTKESEPSMGIIPEYLGGKCLEERLKIFKHFRPIELDYTIDIFPFYGSDIGAASRAGVDFKGALIGTGVSASHGMERTHIKGIENTLKLIYLYLIK